MSGIQTNPSSSSSSIILSYFSLICDLGMIFFPLVGYVAQLVKIKQLGTSNGFSKKLSFILLLANIFRIYFWIGKTFSTVLLFSSIVMVIMQTILLYYCVKFPHDKVNDPKVDYFDISMFWEWPLFLDYFYFFTFFLVILTIVSNAFGYENSIYIETLGFLSAAFEAILGIPQILENYKNKSIISLSNILVLSWLFGDSFKIVYYGINEAPYQILSSSIFQLFTDIIIISQIKYYSKNSSLENS